MNKSVARVLFYAPLLVSVLSPSFAYAQISAQTGAISGRVIDPSSAVIQGATATITSERNVLQSKKTSDSGDFVFPLLDPGSYKVTISAPGFSDATVTQLTVRITEVVNLPIQLQVGSANNEVFVSSDIAQVNTTNATLGEVLPGSVVETMPLATRNFTYLLGNNAATASNLPDASLVGRGALTVFVNGQRGTMNNLVINGVDANSLATNNFNNIPVPSPDAIEEFRVQTSLYDASQGKTSGGNINVLTKGGTPHYHGGVYEFFRNEDLNANAFFFNKSGAQRGILRQNQFGGNIGGPVPKRKDIFFFASYQGTRQQNGLSGAIVAAWPVLPSTRDTASVAAAFGITPAQVDPVALRLLNVKGQFGGYLVPTGTGAAPGQYGSIAYSSPIIFSDDQFNTNGDRIIGSNHRIALRYFHAKCLSYDPFGGGQTLGNGQSGPIANHLASISETWTVSPNIGNEARIGFNRIISGAYSNEPVSLSEIGMTRFNGALYPGIPVFFPLDLTAGFGGIGTSYDQATFGNTVHFSDTLSYVQGKHSFRVGFEGRFYQLNLYNNFASRGSLSFATFRDFIQGTIYQAFVGTGQTYRDFRAHDLSGYFQDDYKVTRRLTLNLGLRYDFMGPTTDRRNRIGNFDPNLLDANTLANGGPGLQVGFILPEGANFGSIKGTPGVSPSTFSVNNNKNFSPRLGFAYDVFGDGKTAIRGGYGIYYVRISNQTLLQLITAAPFFQQSSIINPGTTLVNPYPSLPLPSQFPTFPSLPAFRGYSSTGSPLFSSTLLGLNPIQRNLGTPYAEHYNFSISRELPFKTNLELGYVGSQGVKLLQSLQANQALLANATAPIRGLSANSSGNVNARVGVVGFSSTGLSEVTGNGHSNYNAFTTTLNRRFSGMFLQAAYTFSKSIDNNSGSASQDLGSSGGNNLVPILQRGLSDFDRTHRLQVTYSYAIPGYPRRLLGTVTRNWSFGGTTTFQSAPPINFMCAVCTTNVYGLGTPLYPNLVGDFSQIQKSGDPRNYVDSGTSVWNSGMLAAPPTLAANAVGTSLNQYGGPGTGTYPIGGLGGDANNTGSFLGTLPRNPGIRGPFQQQWDLALSRRFKINERLGFDLRGEFFNLFNHVVFAAPNAIVGSASFGRYTGTITAPRIIQFAAKIVF